MHFVTAKGLLSAQNGMNLYRGCTHGYLLRLPEQVLSDDARI